MELFWEVKHLERVLLPKVIRSEEKGLTWWKMEMVEET
jgi:hypothetical protein